MPGRAEVLADLAEGRQEALRMTGGLETLHPALALSCRLMGVLSAIIQIPTPTMFNTRESLALGGSVARQFVSNEDARHVGSALRPRYGIRCQGAISVSGKVTDGSF